jgi:PadR family transcriptional regulator PadR
MANKKLPNDREEVILMALVAGRKYGREIRDAYESRTNTSMPYGSLYTTLNRMVEKGFIEEDFGSPDEDEDREGDRRKYYKIAAPGLTALNAIRLMAGEIPAKGGLAID